MRRKKVGYERDFGKNFRIQSKSGTFCSIGQIFLRKNAGAIAYSGEPCASAAQQLAHRRRTQPHRLGDFGRTPPVGMQQHHTSRLRAQSRERTRPPRIQHPRIVEGRTCLSCSAPHRRPQPPRLRAVKTGTRKPRVPTFQTRVVRGDRPFAARPAFRRVLRRFWGEGGERFGRRRVVVHEGIGDAPCVRSLREGFVRSLLLVRSRAAGGVRCVARCRCARRLSVDSAWSVTVDIHGRGSKCVAPPSALCASAPNSSRCSSRTSTTL